jgi:hypothetical protein
MDDQLFKKAVTLTDVHFGRSGNSPVANQDNLDFIDWFIEEAKTWGAETCIMMGDWHDNRHSLHVSTMHYSLEGMQKLNDAFEKVWWIPGNHDLLYRNNRDVSSVEIARHLPNVEIVRKPMTLGGVTILPWLVNDEPKAIKNIKSRYVFGHLELPGFMMNAKVEMPHHANGISADDFTENEYVFSGHFHFRQAKGRVVYTGNTFPFNFADAWDDERGMMLMEWGKEPIFKSWPDQPLFRTFKLSELLDKPQALLRPKLTARCTLDIDISFEEAQMLKDIYTSEYQMRKMELVHQPRQTDDTQFVGDVVFQTVDQIVIDGLTAVQSNDLDNQTLIDIYKALPEL